MHTYLFAFSIEVEQHLDGQTRLSHHCVHQWCTPIGIQLIQRGIRTKLLDNCTRNTKDYKGLQRTPYIRAMSVVSHFNPKTFWQA